MIHNTKMSYGLSTGALLRIMKGEVVPEPVFQVMQIKKIECNTDKERYRLLLSDGKYQITYAMLTGVQNPERFMIIRLKKYQMSELNLNSPKKVMLKVLLIMAVDIIASGSAVSDQIGNPIVLTEELIANTKISDESSSASVDSKETKTEESSSDSRPIKQENSSTLNHSLSEGRVISQIMALSPYYNKWVIKARVSNKSEMRAWSSSRGEGNLFSIDLIDESGEIRCTAFNELADKYFNFLQVDKVYYISKCRVKFPEKQFNTLKNVYEMTVGNETVIEECLIDDGLVPRQVKYNFVPIAQAAMMELGSLVDVIGICKEVSDLQTFTSRTSNRELTKREITLMDQSKTSITLTLWNSQAESFDGNNNPVLVIRGAKVGEFRGGKNLSAPMSNPIKINPDIPECHRIKSWFAVEGKDSDIKNLSERIDGGSFQTQWMHLKEVQEKGLGNSEKGDYFQTLATILLIRSENALYRACPTPECNKKVVDLENGTYRCEKCSREYPNFKYRLLVFMNIGDFSGNQWVTAFSSEAEKFLGKTSQELGLLMEDNAEAATAIFQAANFKQFIFKCRTKLETFNDEQRLKTVVVNVEPVDYEKHNSHLTGEIKKYMGSTD